MFQASAPGKIILFGEHAVVYNVLGIATAVDMRTAVSVIKGERDVSIKDPWRDIVIKKEYIEILADKLDKLIMEKKLDDIQKISSGDRNAAQKYVIGLLMRKLEFMPMKITVETELRKGMGTSSSLLSATAMALSDFFSIKLNKKQISGLAYKGDIVAHAGTPSGIDNNTVVYGGYVSFRKSKGPQHLKIKKKLPIVIGDTGKRASTGKMVSKVRKLREKDMEVKKAIENVEKISQSALKAIKENKIEELGELMNKNQELLRKMQVSTPELEKLIKASLDAGAYGTKLSGAGGGGIMFALADNQKKVAKAIKKAGGEPIITSVGAEGVKIIR